MEKVIIFGRGQYFKEKREYIFANYDVKEIWDSSVEFGKKIKHETIWVINPKEADISGTEKILLLSVNFFGMWRSLVEMGVDLKRIVVPYNIQNKYENDEVLCNCVSEISFYRDYITVNTYDNGEIIIKDEREWRALLRQLYKESYPIINAISAMDTKPISAQFGTERGTPIDRYYIERFLAKRKEFITGDVLEIEDNSYTKLFGAKECQSLVMNVSSGAPNVDFVANLETGEGIREGVADCFICTQTLMYIYNLESAVNNIYTLLKRNGVLLLTCSGISQNSRRCMEYYGCTFNYNYEALIKLFGDNSKYEIIDCGSYGNVKTVCAHLAGLCQEDLKHEDFIECDKYYPLIVYAVIRRVN